jgi:hypothetical protein
MKLANMIQKCKKNAQKHEKSNPPSTQALGNSYNQGGGNRGTLIKTNASRIDLIQQD